MRKKTVSEEDLFTTVQKKKKRFSFHCGMNDKCGIGVITVPAENGVLCDDGEYGG